MTNSGNSGILSTWVKAGFKPDGKEGFFIKKRGDHTSAVVVIPSGVPVPEELKNGPHWRIPGNTEISGKTAYICLISRFTSGETRIFAKDGIIIFAAGHPEPFPIPSDGQNEDAPIPIIEWERLSADMHIPTASEEAAKGIIPPPSAELSGPPGEGGEGEGLADKEVIRFTCKQGGALWSGDTSGYPSACEAGAALMCILAHFTGKNMDQMKRIFLKSGLAKRKKEAQSLAYIDSTIDSACRKVTKVYHKRSTQQKDAKGFVYPSSWRPEVQHVAAPQAAADDTNQPQTPTHAAGTAGLQTSTAPETQPAEHDTEQPAPPATSWEGITGAGETEHERIETNRCLLLGGMMPPAEAKTEETTQKPEEVFEGYRIGEDGVPEFHVDGHMTLRWHLAEMAKFCLEMAVVPRPLTAWIATVMFSATVCGRHFCFHGFVYSLLYMCVFADSGAGKGDIMNCIKLLALEVGCRDLIASGDGWTADSGVHASIAENPQSVACWDEMGAMLKKMVNGKDGGIGKSALTELTKQYTSAHTMLMPKGFADRKIDGEPKREIVNRPCMSVVGMGVPSDMQVITEDMIESGVMARWLFIEIGHEPRFRTAGRGTPRLPDDTKQYIRDILLMTGREDYDAYDPATHAPHVPIVLAPAKGCPLPASMELTEDSLKPKTWNDYFNAQQVASAALPSSSDRALKNRELEMASRLAIPATILGVPECEAEVRECIRQKDVGVYEPDCIIHIPRTVFEACIEEAGRNAAGIKALWAKNSAYSERAKKQARIAAEYILNRLQQGTPYVFLAEVKSYLKEEGLQISGKIFDGKTEYIQILEQLETDYGIYYRKEGNTQTGRGYFYDGIAFDAQAKMEEFDDMVRTAVRSERTQQAERPTKTKK